jgi:hypothetical protein
VKGDASLGVFFKVLTGDESVPVPENVCILLPYRSHPHSRGVSDLLDFVKSCIASKLTRWQQKTILICTSQSTIGEQEDYFMRLTTTRGVDLF